MVASSVAVFSGRNGVGLITTGAVLAGDTILSIVDIATGVDSKSSFGPVIPALGHIAQISGSDLSGNTYVALIAR